MSFTQWLELDTISGAESIYQIKEMLKLAGWTVQSSSDGTTFNAAGDEITHGGVGAGGMANNNAWFRISNPDGVEYVIQRGTANTVWRVKVGGTGTFTAGTPGATQVPASTADEFVMLGTGTDAAPGFETWFGVDNSYRLKAGADSASPYHFYAFAFDIGGGAGEFVFTHEGLSAGEPADASPFLSVCGGNGCLDSNLESESASGNGTRSYASQPDAAPVSGQWGIVGALVYESNTAQVVPVALPTSPISGNDLTFPIPYGRRAAVSNPGWKGVGSMMRWNGTIRNTGDTLTVSTVRDRIVCDDVNFPWQGTVPTV